MPVVSWIKFPNTTKRPEPARIVATLLVKAPVVVAPPEPNSNTPDALNIVVDETVMPPELDPNEPLEVTDSNDRAPDVEVTVAPATIVVVLTAVNALDPADNVPPLKLAVKAPMMVELAAIVAVPLDFNTSKL